MASERTFHPPEVTSHAFARGIERRERNGQVKVVEITRTCTDRNERGAVNTGRPGGGAPERAKGAATLPLRVTWWASVRDRVLGAYVMPPFSHWELAPEVIGGFI